MCSIMEPELTGTGFMVRRNLLLRGQRILPVVILFLSRARARRELSRYIRESFRNDVGSFRHPMADILRIIGLLTQRVLTSTG